MSCIVGPYRGHHVQRLHLTCALWVQRVNCYVRTSIATSWPSIR
jgi:hypothetical protein